MKKNWIVIFLLMLGNGSLYSQQNSEKEPAHWYSQINVEAGLIYPDGSIRDGVSIRQNISSFYVDQASNGTVYSDSYGAVLGVNWEYMSQKLKLGFSGGLRCISFQTEIYGNSSSRSNFFYLRYSMLSNNTKFARVKGLSESVSYISMPIELKYIPFEYQNFKFFVSAGFEFSLIKFAHETDIDFQEKAMESYNDDILEIISTPPNDLYASLYATAGISFGQERKTNYSFEFFFPSTFVSHDNFSLTDVKNFTGFKFSIQFPLSKNL